MTREHQHHAKAHALHGHTEHEPGSHVHPGVAEDYAARPHPEFVVLDVGEAVGALIVHTDPEMHGVEIEISPAADEHDRSHKQVLERRVDQRAAFTAVFDGLPAGRYTLWVEDQARARDVLIEGSTVAELDWRAEPRDAPATAPVPSVGSGPGTGTGAAR